MRINRYLAACGLGSRRSCEELVLSGRVEISGKVVHELSTEVAENAHVSCDGIPVRPPEIRHVVLFHKPKGCVCARREAPEILNTRRAGRVG